jgi:hypothetical protein
MAERKKSESRVDTRGFDAGFKGHARCQARIGLDLTPAERLRWLEETMEQLRGLLGRAQHGRPVEPKAD